MTNGHFTLKKSKSTFYAADPPEPGVRQVPPALFGLRLALVRRNVGRVADVRPRVQPVVRAHGDAHEAKRHERTRRGQEGLERTVAPSHRAS